MNKDGTVKISIEYFDYLRQHEEYMDKAISVFRKCLVFEKPDEDWNKGKVMDIVMKKELVELIMEMYSYHGGGYIFDESLKARINKEESK